jgi:hypothetical protein
MLLGLFLSAPGCSEHIQVGRDYPGGGSGDGSAASSGSGGLALNVGGSSGTPNGASGGGATTHGCQVTACQNKIYRCGNCLDDDGDQLIDADDPDCTGPCDDTEDSYFGGIPGQNNAPCRQDCYFDQDTGSGNDQCFWSQDCDSLSVAPSYPPSGDAHCAYNPQAMIPGSGSSCAALAQAEPSACLSSCLPITPNGCDCFGCCELPAESGKYVWIGSSTQNVGTCDAAHVADPLACRPCTPVASCFNSCDPCEVCVGRTTPGPGCTAPGTGRCPVAQAACGQPGESACGAGYYCITGCCAAAPR